MNYGLAMMALEGLTRAPMNVRFEGGEVIREAHDIARAITSLEM